MKQLNLLRGAGLCLAGICALFLLSVSGMQAETGHYVNGVEGIKGASVPPPGLYYRLYTLYYTADTLTDPGGNEIPIDFDVSVFAMVNRLIWSSKYEVLGGNFFADAIIPITYTDLSVGPMGDDEWAIADLYIEPAGIAWHGPQYDAAVGISFYLPTADYSSTEMVNAGKGFWTTMLTAGATVYFDAERTWSASLLARYEIHGEQDETEITPGDDFHFEWGIGKTINKTWDIGLAGYCHWRVSEDSGPGATNAKDEVYAIGPEILNFIPNAKLFVSLRSLFEFGAENRSEGMITTLTLTKIF